jgi:hypothetical protein
LRKQLQNSFAWAWAQHPMAATNINNNPRRDDRKLRTTMDFFVGL